MGIWESVTGWWTPGWGNLFTIALATAALASGAWYNRKTLKRTDERFTQGRIDARNDKLRNEIADLFAALSERVSFNAVHGPQTSKIQPPSQPAEFPRYIKEMRSVLESTIAPLHRKVVTHTFAVQMLTTDMGIIEPVQLIEKLANAEIRDMRQVLDRAQKAETVASLLAVTGAVLLAGVSALPRQGQIDAATDELRAHCLRKLPVRHGDGGVGT